MKQIHILFLLGACILGSAGGCGNSDGKVPISGTVYVDDKPMEGVSVAFLGNSGGSYDSAVTGAGGKFSARVAPGMNRVALAKKDNSKVQASASDDPEMQTMGTEAQVAAIMKNAPPDLIAAKFGDPLKSGLEFDLRSGSTIDLRVTSK